jgi:tripartite-type tricarboxylate transporter receptor subunit TctC
MKKSRHTGEQVACVLRQAESGTPVSDVCSSTGISQATFYGWSALAPDVPTLDEAGVPGVSVPSWQALFGPPKLPRDIVGRLARETGLAERDPEVRAKFEQQSLQAAGSTPEVLAATIKEDLRAWSRFIRDNGITSE